MVVPRFPPPVRNVALFPELAEMVAVGVPELILMAANLAEAVELAPIKRSRVSLLGEIAPDAILQLDPPFPQDPKVGVVPPNKH